MSYIIVYTLLICSLHASWECGEYYFDNSLQCQDKAQELIDAGVNDKFIVRCTETKTIKWN